MPSAFMTGVTLHGLVPSLLWWMWQLLVLQLPNYGLLQSSMD